jgi:hypothetical protein
MAGTVPNERAAVVRRVRALLKEGFVQLPKGISSEPGEPMAVGDSDGHIHSWMVPFVADGRLIAWAQIGRALEFLRFSLLAGGRIGASPDAADWLDVERISARIAEAAGIDRLLSPPVLTYDRDPSRLVWAAEVKTADEKRQRWFAAGVNVWRDRGVEEITGGPVVSK